MKRSREIPIPLLAAAALLVGGGAGAQSVTAVRSSIKVRPNTTPAAASSIELHAGKNEFEAFQAVVLGGASGLSSVTVVAPTLKWDTDNTVTIPASQVRLYREQTIYFSQPSNLEGAAGWWPDPLVPDVEDGPAIFQNGSTFTEGTSTGETRNAFPFPISPNDNGVVFVDIHVPDTQQIGRYTGTLTVKNGTSTVGTISVVLIVYNFSIRSTSSLPSTFGMAIDQVCAAHGAAPSGWCANGNPDFHLWAKLYGRFFLDHRLTVELPDSPDVNNWPATLSNYNADYGPIINGADPAPRRLAGSQMTTIRHPWGPGACGKSGWPTCPDQTSQTTRMSNWVTFTKDAANAYGRPFSWFSRTFHYAQPDEPGATCSNWQGANSIIDQGNWAHGIDPDFRVMVTGSVASYNACGGGSSVNILDPVLDELDNRPGTNHRGDYASFLGARSVNQIWMYQSCDQHGCADTTSPDAVNWPDLTVDATGVQNRAEPWMHYIYDMPGMLYFDSVMRLPQAWNNDGIYAFTGQGDGTLVYPGTPTTVSGGSSYAIGGTSHIPVASLRLKMMREGLEDYEYLKLCEAATSRANALSIANTVFPMTNGAGAMYTANNYPNSDPVGFANKLEAARDQLITCIVPGGPPSVTLAKSGSGTGRVTSSPAGIDCVSSCTSQSAPFASGTVVTLTATVDAGSTFGGFSGGCTSSSTSCTFTVGSSTTVNAVFNSPNCTTQSDCFDRPDSSTLGPGWNTYWPAIEISSSQARNTDINSKASQFLTSVGSDQDVSVDCKVTGAGSNCGIMGRWSDASNHYYTYIDGGLGTIDLWRVQAGVTTKIGNAARSIAFNTYYRLRLLIQGTQISVYFAGEPSAAISVADGGVTAGNYGGLHAFAGAAYAVWWDNFKIVAAPGGPAPLFSDNFNRTSGLGANWSVPWGPFTTDGAYAVSGTPPIQGNWAQVLPNLGTNNYAVVADIIVPANSFDSGVVARSNDSSDFTDNLYSAQLSTDGSVYLYRRNTWNWTQLGSYPAGIVAGTRYSLKLVATGSSPVHLEVWLDGTQRITYDDSPGFASGSVGMVNYDANVKYDNFNVYQQ